jgi:cytochrome c biogenesis protein
MPADDQGGMDGFLRLRAALADPGLREQAVQRYAPPRPPTRAGPSWRSSSRPRRRARWRCSPAPSRGRRQGAGGLQAVSDFMEANVPEAERNRAGEVLVRILNGALFELAQMSREQAGLKPLARDEKTQAFMTQAVLALSDAFAYPARWPSS